ncbi:MAG: FapA family protein [Phycisphaerales bacterium JB063]
MPEATNNPRARHERHVIHMPVLFRTLTPDGQPVPPQHAIAVDFSYSGLRLATDHALSKGTEVGIRLVCQGNAQGEIRAVTRWSHQLEGGGYHQGMQFAEEGAILPFLGLDQEAYRSKLETTVKGPGIIQARGTTRINRIDRLNCKIQGDLEVDHGLNQANLIVEGQLKVSGSGIVGGQTRVSMQIDLAKAGDSDNTPTHLELAFLADDIADVRRRAQQHLDSDLADIEACQAQVARFNGEGGGGTHEDREKLTALMFEIQSKEATINELKEKIDLLDGLIERKTCGRLSVHEVIHPGVRVSKHGTAVAFESIQPLPGPVYIHADKDGQLHIKDAEGQEAPLESCPAFRQCA